MKKWIFLMVFVCMIFTAGAVFDGLDNQDMTEPTIHFWEKNPMKYNTYAKGQCTYYVFDRVKEDHYLISNQWGDAKHWANKAKKQGYTVNENPTKGSILHYPKGKHGHVAYVEQVNNDGSLIVSDMNFRKPYEITTRFVDVDQVDQFNYIHPKSNTNMT
ncbi:CHAP domain-containing protein [Staphylococcus hominis]|uniref:CHAP domain-containing protein n=1 Tax=Staphylococcus hominis TaxID=1290 RepID=UPI0007789AAB|nr:CHAP domain-containing protein [Staphylococcus hominis]OAW32600.1 peptidoglycan-binding protein LysM [Staphylococcus hominis]